MKYAFLVAGFLYCSVTFAQSSTADSVVILNKEAKILALKEKITAKLFNNKYIPEFYAAVKAHKSKTPIAAEVYKVSPYGIFLNLFGDKIQSKLGLSATNEAPVPGAKINVIITHIGDSRIVVEQVP